MYVVDHMWWIVKWIMLLFFQKEEFEATITPKVSACSTPGKIQISEEMCIGKTKEDKNLTGFSFALVLV